MKVKLINCVVEIPFELDEDQAFESTTDDICDWIRYMNGDCKVSYDSFEEVKE